MMTDQGWDGDKHGFIGPGVPGMQIHIIIFLGYLARGKQFNVGLSNVFSFKTEYVMIVISVDEMPGSIGSSPVLVRRGNRSIRPTYYGYTDGFSTNPSHLLQSEGGNIWKYILFNKDLNNLQLSGYICKCIITDFLSKEFIKNLANYLYPSLVLKPINTENSKRIEQF